MNTRRRSGLVATLVVLVMSCQMVHAQGRVVENGFGVGGGLTDAPGATAVDAGVGYVTGGQLEFGLQAGRTWAEGSSRTINAIQPSAGWYPVRQDEDVPVSIRVGARFRYGRVNGGPFSEDVTVTRNTFGASGMIFHEIESSEAFRILPQAGIAFSRTVQRRSGISLGWNDMMYRVGVGLLFGADGDQPIFIDPYLGISDGRFSGGVGVTLLLPGGW